MISAVIIAKNEEDTIAQCLKSVSWCTEKIVIDNNSTDKTVKIAEKHNATVYEMETENDFSFLRNYGLSVARNDWVLFVDSDEVVSESLAYEITSAISANLENYSGFYIERIDTIWNKELKHGENTIFLLRLGKKDKGEWKGKVHEVWDIQGKTKKLKNPILHFPHISIGALWKAINYYSTIRAEELKNQNVRSSGPLIILYPLAKFVQDYFFKQGFLDGIPGFLMAVSMSFHSFMVRGKLYLLWNKS